MEHPHRLTISAGELIDWYAAWLLDPWGPMREDLRMGAAAAITAGQTDVTIDFPYVQTHTTDDCLAEIARAEKVWNARHGSNDPDCH